MKFPHRVAKKLSTYRPREKGEDVIQTKVLKIHNTFRNITLLWAYFWTTWANLESPMALPKPLPRIGGWRVAARRASLRETEFSSEKKTRTISFIAAIEQHRGEKS